LDIRSSPFSVSNFRIFYYKGKMAKVQAEGEGHRGTGKIKTERAIPKKSPPCFFYFKKKIL